MAIDAQETSTLIGSDKVEGTDVYSEQGEPMGSIARVMIEKRSGQVAYAVLSFGGFMGFDSDYRPVPWSVLTYDTNLGGYRINVVADTFRGAPKYTGDDWDWEDRERSRKVHDYYSAPMENSLR